MLACHGRGGGLTPQADRGSRELLPKVKNECRSYRRAGGPPLARSSNPEPICARAPALTPLAARGTDSKVAVTLLIVLPDGSTTVAEPFLSHSQQFNGVIR